MEECMGMKEHRSLGMVSFPGLGTCGSLIDGEGTWQDAPSIRGHCFLAQANATEFTILQPLPPYMGVHIPTSRFYLVLRIKPKVLYNATLAFSSN